MSGRNRRVDLVTRLSVMSLFCSLENPIKCLYLPIDLVKDVGYCITGMMYVQWPWMSTYLSRPKNTSALQGPSSTSHPFHYLVAPRPDSPSVVYLAFPFLLPFSGSGR